jgi:hypothetical protein
VLVQCMRLIRTPARTHAGGASHLDVQKRRREEQDMKGVGRRGGICPLCFDTPSVWKAGRGYIAAAQTRGGMHMHSAAQQRARWTQGGAGRSIPNREGGRGGISSLKNGRQIMTTAAEAGAPQHSSLSGSDAPTTDAYTMVDGGGL